MHKSIVAIAVAGGSIAAAWMFHPAFSGTAVFAQTGKTTSKSKSSKGDKKQSVKSIDVRAERMRAAFIREAMEVARDYAEAGELQKSKRSLESILELEPALPAVKQQIKKIEEAILSAHEMEIEVDTSQGWELLRARVFKGKTFRIQATGAYRFVVSLPVGPEGFPTDDPSTDMAAGVPCGAMMGLIIAKGKKPGKPFAVKAGVEHTPKEDGLLFLRVNVPPNHKCSGRIKVKLSGHVQSI